MRRFVFYERENIELFNLVKERVEEVLMCKIDRDYLLDSELEVVTWLRISPDLNFNSLNGIENCVNLKQIHLDGIVYHTLKDNNSTKEDDDEITKLLHYNQIEDLTPLYQCSKLEEVCIADQRKIENLDLSYWPNLKFLKVKRCQNLESIKGLQKVVERISEREDISDREHPEIKIGDCFALKNIESLGEVLKIIRDKKLTEDEFKIILPSLFYFKLSNQREFEKLLPILDEIEQNSAKSVLWLENNNYDNGISDAYMHSSHMNLLNKELDEIIKDLFIAHKPKSMLSKMMLTFNWIAQNVEYDVKNYDKMKELEKFNMCDSPLFPSTRSSFVALWNKRVVCVGFSNLYSTFLTKIGVDAYPISCFVPSADEYHSITKVKTKQGTYYCDPTGKHFSFFMLNREQMTMEKGVHLSYLEHVEDDAEDITHKIEPMWHILRLRKVLRMPVVKTTRRIKELVRSCTGLEDLQKLTVEQKEMAKEIADEMEHRRVYGGLFRLN